MGVLEGKVALISGTGRGIGRAVALEFAEQGAAVALAGGHHAHAGVHGAVQKAHVARVEVAFLSLGVVGLLEELADDAVALGHHRPVHLRQRGLLLGRAHVHPHQQIGRAHV